MINGKQTRSHFTDCTHSNGMENRATFVALLATQLKTMRLLLSSKHFGDHFPVISSVVKFSGEFRLKVSQDMFALRKTITSAIRNGKNFCKFQEKHTLPPLPYDYKALEPVICSEIMEIHHTKHHAAYVNGLNDAEEKMKAAIEKSDFPTVISLADAMRFNGGGHINHSLFWENMSPKGGQPSDQLACTIAQDFGSLDKMKELMSQLAVSVQGSGWAWLGFNPTSGKLQLAKCLNQDPLQPTTGLVPLLGIDVWEHAYYLQYKNVRAEYVKHFWDIVNWNKVSERLTAACEK